MKKLLLILLCLGLVGCAGTGFDYGVKRQQSMNTAKRNNQNRKGSVLDNVYSAAPFPQLSTSHLRFPSPTL